MLAEFLTDFADAGQAALAESSVQGLQSLPIYLSNMLLDVSLNLLYQICLIDMCLLSF